VGGVVVICLYALLANRRAGLSMRRSILGATLFGLVGFGLVLLKQYFPLPVLPPGERGDTPPFVSTGALPADARVQALVDEALARFGGENTGVPSQVYPALARVAPGLFGICVAGVGGATYSAGDVGVEFTIMSVAKPFVFALVCDALGSDAARAELGVNATGLPFNSPGAVEQGAGGRTNPTVNAVHRHQHAKRIGSRPGMGAPAGGPVTLRGAAACGSTRTSTSPRRALTTATAPSADCCTTTGASPATPTRRLTSTRARARWPSRRRPGDDGRDAGRRRRASHHPGARRRRGRLPPSAERHDDGRPLRDLR
jgi:hypothetical protein